MKTCTVTALKKAIDDNKKCVILDVRTQGEFARGKIEGAIPDKSSLIYEYCLSASRSCIAVEIMENLGYQNTVNVEYGLMDWRKEGYPLTT